jgi:stage II sporulation protein P
LAVAAVLLLVLGLSVWGGARWVSQARLLAEELDERTDGGYFTVVDPEGRVLLWTGRLLVPGDEFITADNEEYVVHRIEGDTAHARFRRRIEPARSTWQWSRLWPGSWAAQPTQTDTAPKVGILHSHSDESYQPSDGTESRPGQGGIMRVGARLASALREQGLQVVHERTAHDPHDAGAYARSRRTASDLLRQNANVVFDVHRDAAPPQAYQAEVGGQPVTQIMLVVGRQNPKLASNLAFAQDLMEKANQRHPQLVRGILKAAGRYNQDLADRMLILEVGAHTNRREDAERAVTLLAEVVPEVLGAAPGGRQSRGGYTALAWVLGLVVFGAGAYLYISTGSWQELRSKLKHFFGREFADLGGSRPDGEDQS